MKKTLLFATLTAIAFVQCRTLHVSDFHQTARVTEPLPRMGLLVHQESFAAAFDRETSMKGWGGHFFSQGPVTPGTYVALSDLPLEDVYAVLGNEISDNLAGNTGDRFGHIRFRLLNYNRRAPGWGYTIPSTMSFYTLNTLGMPYTRLQAEVELQVEVADANKKILARYKASGQGKAWVALYYGYQRTDAWRKANLLALQDAMVNIRAQMAEQLPQLNARLAEAGPLPKRQ